MKKTAILSLISVALISTAFIQSKITIKIKGSDTVLPLSQKEAEVFMKTNKSRSIVVTGGGSGVGLAALLDGTTDVAMSSRKIKLSEKMKLQEAGKTFKEATIAYDALSIIVHPSNKVSQLTREQVEGIYTGKIKNWKEVGGDDLVIVAYSRESSSGTYEFFKEVLLDKKNYGTNILMMPATGAIIQSVTQTKGAIGYVGLAYVEKTVKDLKISMDKGKTFVEPTYENAKSRKYPVVRPLYYYYLNTTENNVKPFMDFIFSAEGQKIVTDVGYIPLK